MINVTMKIMNEFSPMTSTPLVIPENSGLYSVMLREFPEACADSASDVARGYLDTPIHRELSKDVLSKIVISNVTNIVVTEDKPLYERIKSFNGVNLLIDVETMQDMLSSEHWSDAYNYCISHKIHFFVFGVIKEGKYVHHTNIPDLAIITLVPQYLTDTLSTTEDVVGIQLPHGLTRSA